MGQAAKFFRLSRRDRDLALAALRTLAVTWIGLRTVGFASVRTRAARVIAPRPGAPHEWCGPPPRSALDPPDIERISWAVRAASRFIPGGSNCLLRALATQALLGRFGIPSNLRIGVRKAGDRGLAAHAWLESAGAVVIGEFELEHYVPLAPPDSRPTGSTA
jgi:Transglutaminase-like superfamily